MQIDPRLYRVFITATIALVIPFGIVTAHDLQYQIQAQSATVLHLFFADNSKFSYENFEIRAPGESVVFQKGGTDQLGRVALLPDRPGKWNIKVFSTDGHGTEVNVEVAADQVVTTYSRSLFDRYSRTFAGAGFILGIFGLITFFQQPARKR